MFSWANLIRFSWSKSRSSFRFLDLTATLLGVQLRRLIFYWILKHLRSIIASYNNELVLFPCYNSFDWRSTTPQVSDVYTCTHQITWVFRLKQLKKSKRWYCSMLFIIDMCNKYTTRYLKLYPSMRGSRKLV